MSASKKTLSHTKVLVIASQKGGSAKTTTAINMAVAAHRDGRSVALIDTDKQATCQFWATTRGLNDIPVQTVDADRLGPSLQALDRIGCDLAVIDTQPAVTDTTASIIGRADFVLLPTEPSPFDLRATLETITQCRTLGRPFGILLSKCPPQHGDGFERSVSLLAQLNAELCPHVMHRYIAHSRAQTQGLTAQEFDPDGKAAAEIARVYEYTCRHLDLPRLKSKRRSP